MLIDLLKLYFTHIKHTHHIHTPHIYTYVPPPHNLHTPTSIHTHTPHTPFTKAFIAKGYSNAETPLHL